MGGKSTFKSSISGIEFPEHDRVWGKSIRATIFDLIKNNLFLLVNLTITEKNIFQNFSKPKSKSLLICRKM